MTNTPKELARPLTAIEQAELSAACQKVLTTDGMLLLRRLLWTLGANGAELAETKRLLVEAKDLVRLFGMDSCRSGDQRDCDELITRIDAAIKEQK